MFIMKARTASIWAALSYFLSTAGGGSISPIYARNVSCPKDYTDYAEVGHAPYSSGKYHLPYQRPPRQCRTYVSQDVEDGIEMMKDVITDPDLFQMFQNSYPNTLDTTVKWRGKAEGTDEELSFVITGDINAMWIRDSTSQLHSYLRFLNASSSPDSLASLFRGLINLQTRYLLDFPYCNAFHPPKESGIPPVNNTEENAQVTVTPTPDYDKVWQCKYELDSIVSFLQLSANYYNKTGDSTFFSQYQWIDAVKAGMELIEAQTYPTYYPNGSVVIAPYTYSAFTDRATETLTNNAYGEPIDGSTGLVRSTFRPSDDACTYELFVPGNMMLVANLEATIPILQALGGQDALVDKMSQRAQLIRAGISRHAITSTNTFAYEIDGYGSINWMDDAGVPSLLSAPYLGYLPRDDETYQNTRRKALSTGNPYYMHGPVINGTGSPHIGPGWSWPMGVIMQILTSDDDEEIVHCLDMLVSSTNGTGLVHESILATDQAQYTRSWFAWVNGLFGEMIFDLYDRKRHLLKTSFQ